MVFFLFTESKAGERPVELLEGFSGEVLLVDGGSEFNGVVRQRELKPAGCYSHLRSYFYDALQHHPEEAHLRLGTIRDLFAIDRELRCQAPEVVLAGRAARCSEPSSTRRPRWWMPLALLTQATILSTSDGQSAPRLAWGKSSSPRRVKGQ
jgi:hypothetical protein